jgi:hypothetical protein
MSRLYSAVAQTKKAPPKQEVKPIQTEVKKVVSSSEFPSMKQSYKVSEQDFQVWLDEMVWVCDNEKGTRREYIPHLADAITDWMRSIGYTMDSRWGKGHRIVAKWLYTIQVLEIARRDYGAPLAYPEIIHRDWAEDYDMFTLNIEYDTIEQFLGTWNTVEDLDPEMRWGQRAHDELQTLLWHYIDLDASKVGIKLAEKLITSDSDSDSGGGRARKSDDVYLQEAREGMHGGRGYKV